MQQDIDHTQTQILVYQTEFARCRVQMNNTTDQEEFAYWEARWQIAHRLLSYYQDTYRALVAYKQLCDLRS